eukprot:748807_1
MEDQNIIISGESGSGKTESAKLIMFCLSELGSSDDPLDQQILNSAPVLEAFGNAKTTDNKNASLFGKYVQVNFSPNGEIRGAHIQTYLLKKAHVCRQAKSDRNLHIFYQLCAAAASDDSLGHLELGTPSSFNFLNQNDSDSIKGVNDSAEFLVTVSDMKLLGFSEQERGCVFQLLAAILHLGNLEFGCEEVGDVDDTKNNSHIMKDSNDSLTHIQKLSGIDSESLERALCHRAVSASDSAEVFVPVCVDSARAARDSLAEHLFAELFDWIVRKINWCTGCRDKDALDGCRSIG